MTQPYLNAVGTALPPHEVHAEFIHYATDQIDPEERATFLRMVEAAGIARRYAVVEPAPRPRAVFLDVAQMFRRGAFPGTAARMAVFAEEAPKLALAACHDLARRADIARTTHLVVASCTGFSAPGIDFRLMQALGLPDSTERTMIGFMGCFAAVNALKYARHIVRSEPEAVVLVVNVELCSLHMQEDTRLEKVLSFLLFGDAASACLVTAEPRGLALGPMRAMVLPRTEDMITWDITDTGFSMHLSGQVPGRIRRHLMDNDVFGDVSAVKHWAVHAGGRSVLDAVTFGLSLPDDALRHSRDVLAEHGNLSSVTLPFVLAKLLAEPASPGAGIAMAFGPGMTVESFAFAVPDAVPGGAAA